MQVLRPAGPAARVPPGQGARGRRPQAVRRRHPADACWRRCIRESWETAKTAESLKPITDPSIRNLKFEDGQPDRVRPPGRGPARDQARAHGRLPGRAAGRAGGRRARSTSSSPRLQEQKAAWIPVEGAQARARARWCGSRWRRIEDGTAPAPRSRTTWCWARTRRSRSSRSGSWRSRPARPADAEVTFPDDHPDESRRGQSRRVRVTLHEVKRQELPAARRRVRARGRRLRDPRRAPRGRPPGPGARGRRGRPTRRCARRCVAQVVEANNVHGARVAGAPADARLRRDVPDPAGAARAVRAAVPPGRRGAGAAGPGARRGGRSQQGLRATEAEIDARVGELADGARRAGRPALRPRCRRPTGCPSSSAAITEEKVFAWLLSAVHCRRGDVLTMATLYPPYIIERSSRGERTYDIFSRLLMDRIVFLGTPINDDVANIIIAQLLFLEADNPEQGHLPLHQLAGRHACRRAWRSTTRCSTCKAPVNTICMGMAARMGVVPAGGRHARASAARCRTRGS